jgi:tetratricopeptide (TPR) repeat protein
MFATGGIFFGMAYTVLNFYIGFRAIKAIRIAKGDYLVFLSGLFGAWLAYQAQAIVSIENIGMAVWGWMLGGSLLALSRGDLSVPTKSNQSSIALQPIYSLGLVLLTLLFLVNLVKSESQTMQAQILFNANNNNAQELQSIAKKIIDNPVADPNYKIAASNFLLTVGASSAGIDSLQKIVEQDSRSTQALSSLANYYESIGNYPDAINYRLKVAKFDPYNCRNYLKLGTYYKKQGDLISTAMMLDKILRLAPNSDVATAARQELRV